MFCFFFDTLDKQEDIYITVKQADELKEQINIIADCENKDPNAIHFQLKKRFNYIRYENITKPLLVDINEFLNENECLKGKAKAN